MRGGTVRNLGATSLKRLIDDGVQAFEFQVGDKFAKPLFVSKIRESKKVAFLGPAPRCESYIVDYHDAFAAAKETRPNIELYNGAHSIRCHEVFHGEGLSAVGDSGNEEVSASSASSNTRLPRRNFNQTQT